LVIAVLRLPWPSSRRRDFHERRHYEKYAFEDAEEP
jgi:hypothetical protein